MWYGGLQVSLMHPTAACTQALAMSHLTLAMARRVLVQPVSEHGINISSKMLLPSRKMTAAAAFHA